MIKSGAYLSHGSEMLSKLYTVWERMTGLIPYIIWSFMESRTALCVLLRGVLIEHDNTETVRSGGGGKRVNTRAHSGAR